MQCNNIVQRLKFYLLPSMFRNLPPYSQNRQWIHLDPSKGYLTLALKAKTMSVTKETDKRQKLFSHSDKHIIMTSPFHIQTKARFPYSILKYLPRKWYHLTK